MDEVLAGHGVVLVMPTYQEADSIDAALDAALSSGLTDLSVLVVDDKSPDGTAEIVRSRPDFGAHVFLLTPSRRAGLGAAYRHGFRWALEKGADVVVQMDADGSHPVGRLPAMVASLSEADLVVGSRYVAGGEVADWSLSRRLVSRAANGYARRVLGLRTRDCTSGFRVWRADAVRRLRLTDTTENGYGFQVETTCAAERAGCPVRELPIRFVDRRYGSSKMSWSMALWAAIGVARLRLDEAVADRVRMVSTTVMGIAVVPAVLARLPYLRLPLGSDEAGYLMVGSQWSPGASLYGNYWVDRPPGLVLVFSLVHVLGGPVALRVIGLMCAVASVLVAARLGQHLAPSRPVAAAVTGLLVAALLSSPLLAVDMVDGELLALPFALVGVAALLRAVPRGPTDSSTVRRRVGWALLAGASGCFAFAVKQSFAEVGILALVLAGSLIGRRAWRPALLIIGGVAAGAALVAAVLVAYSAFRGTDPAGLWDAVIGFRARASVLIADDATSATPARARGMVMALAATGAPLVLLLLARLRWRPPAGASAEEWFAVDVSRLCAALVVYESIAIGGGGSYWLHYLVQAVPALALVMAASLAIPPRRAGTTRRRGARAPMMVVGVVTVSSLVCSVAALGNGHGPPAGQEQVAGYLRAHADRGRSAVVLFGNAGLLFEAGMTSPYENLWSLPVRVRDPKLSVLTSLLRGSRGPHWVVLSHAGLHTWGLDAAGAAAAERVLDHRYRVVAEIGGYTVLELHRHRPAAI